MARSGRRHGHRRGRGHVLLAPDVREPGVGNRTGVRGRVGGAGTVPCRGYVVGEQQAVAHQVAAADDQKAGAGERSQHRGTAVGRPARVPGTASSCTAAAACADGHAAAGTG